MWDGDEEGQQRHRRRPVSVNSDSINKEPELSDSMIVLPLRYPSPDDSFCNWISVAAVSRLLG